MSPEEEEEWVRALLRQARRIARRFYRTSHDQEDAVQSAVEHLLMKRADRPGDVAQPKFIETAVKRLFIDLYRGNGRREQALRRFETQWPLLREAHRRDGWDLVSWEEVRHLVEDSGRLSDEDLQLADHWAAGASFDDLVQELGKSRATIFRRRAALPARIRRALVEVIIDRGDHDYAAMLLLHRLERDS